MPQKPLDYEGPRPTRRRRCPACRSDLTVAGKVTGGGLVAAEFKPKKTSSWMMKLEGLPLAALACCACGTVTLYVNRAGLVDLAGDPSG